MEPPVEFPNILHYNQRVRHSAGQMGKMVTFHPDHEQRVLEILFYRSEKRQNLCSLPVFLIPNINAHPEELDTQLTDINYPDLRVKMNAFHFLTAADINLNAENLDVVDDSLYHWVRKGETNLLSDEWCYGVKREYIWKRKQRRRRNEPRGEKEKHWRMAIYTFSPAINDVANITGAANAELARSYRVEDLNRVNLWKLVTISPTKRRVRRARQEQLAAPTPAAAPPLQPDRLNAPGPEALMLTAA